MKISLAGEDVTEELSDALGSLSGTREDSGAKADSDVIDLSRAESESEYSDLHIEKLRPRVSVDTARISPSGLVRKVCWRVIRFFFDWVVHKQNNINEQIVHAIEMEKRERDRQVRELRAELEDLRKK